MFKWLQHKLYPEPDFSIFPDEFKNRYRILKVETRDCIKYRIEYRLKDSSFWHQSNSNSHRASNDEAYAKHILYWQMLRHYKSEVISETPINI